MRLAGLLVSCSAQVFSYVSRHLGRPARPAPGCRGRKDAMFRALGPQIGIPTKRHQPWCRWQQRG
eukprot:1880620-Pyramimonas_sp.AAC.1